MIKILTFLIFIVFSPMLHAQSLSGDWYGIGNIQMDGETDQYLAEFNLIQKGNLVSGNLNYYFRDSLFNLKIKGSYNKEKRSFQFFQVPLVFFRSNDFKDRTILNMDGYFELRVAKTGSVLTGTLFNNTEKRFTVPLLTFRLKRDDGFFAKRNNSDSSIDAMTEVVQPSATASTLPSPAMMKDASSKELQLISAKAPPSSMQTFNNISVDTSLVTTTQFKARKKDYAKIIEVEHSTVRIELYDNGTIDFDSVSLFLNNELILPKTMLTHRSVKLTIPLNLDLAFNELGMFAENLGMIPPNTAAIIIHDGTKSYEVNLNSDFNKNAIIQLKTKKASPQ